MFFQRRKKLEVADHMRLICELTSSEDSGRHDRRSEKRYNRSIPVAVHPKQPNLRSDDLLVCLAHNLSDQGIGLIVSNRFTAKTILIGFWLETVMDDPWFFESHVRTVEQTGTGLWRIGAELTEFMNHRRHAEIESITDATKELLTRDCVPT